MKSYRFWGSVIVVVLLIVWAVILGVNNQSEDAGSEQTVEVAQ